MYIYCLNPPYVGDGAAVAQSCPIQPVLQVQLKYSFVVKLKRADFVLFSTQPTGRNWALIETKVAFNLRVFLIVSIRYPPLPPFILLNQTSPLNAVLEPVICVWFETIAIVPSSYFRTGNVSADAVLLATTVIKIAMTYIQVNLLPVINSIYNNNKNEKRE